MRASETTFTRGSRAAARRHRVARAVLGAVVDEDQLVVDAVQRRRDPLGERVDGVLLLVHRGHHAQQLRLAVHARQGTGVTLFAMVDDAALERELFEVGRRLAAALPTTRNPLKALDDKAMDLASSDAELKAALFRFVDVVPACRNLDDLARHLTGFLEEVERAAAADRRGDEDGQLEGGPARRWGWPRRRASSTWRTASSSARTRRPRWAYLRELWKDGVASSVDLLGEATVTQSEAQRYADRCADALDTIARAARGWPARPQLERDTAGPLPRANLSVKVCALTPLLRPDAPERGKRDAADRLRPLLRRAHERGAHLHIDMESMDSRDAVLELILELLAEDEFRAGPSAGLVLQGYLRDSPQTLDTILEWLGARRARAPADDPAGQGRLLGPRARPGRAARLAHARCSSSRPTPTRTSSCSRGGCSTRGRRPRGDRLAQPALGGPMTAKSSRPSRSRRSSRDSACARSSQAAATPSTASSPPSSACRCRRGFPSITRRRFPKRSSRSGRISSSAGGCSAASACSFTAARAASARRRFSSRARSERRCWRRRDRDEKCDACLRLGAIARSTTRRRISSRRSARRPAATA